MTESFDSPAHETPTATAQWVAETLRDRIVKGVYPAGSRIVERAISTELNVSRTPVREALKLVAADGLIVISRNKGAQVLQYGAEDALALFDVIAALESLAAERLAARMDAETLDVFEEMHDRMMTYYKIGNHTDYFDTNTEIHDAIVQRCGNEILAGEHRKLMARARRGRFLAIMRPERLTEAIKEHDALMEALRQKDPARAARIWRTHLLHTGDTVAALL
ncbi:GntR family transcriptional regulator [Poseidonocella sedimentorum]|uniref:DNA-binding transcriptional regulator, GntR family n=1 Tax=Poseidonocella sedimentorum TaxID=871652 RepID=A0A1I6D7Y0_9RHOB|nr:GntR family transcriptional regulator [Poseidonocella sedimentorum]SFR01481.1 DNA-binding transcriptional regulator, GntR family [Poseidonocella sedimentorum]